MDERFDRLELIAVGTINRHSVQIIRDAGIEVIEPDDDFYGEE